MYMLVDVKPKEGASRFEKLDFYAHLLSMIRWAIDGRGNACHPPQEDAYEQFQEHYGLEIEMIKEMDRTAKSIAFLQDEAKRLKADIESLKATLQSV